MIHPLASRPTKPRRLNDALTPDEAAVWAMVEEAAQVERSMPGARGRGYPGKSAWPDFPDEISYFGKLRMVLSGELDICDTAIEAPRIVPTGAQIDLHAAVTWTFQRHALRGYSARRDMLKALWAYAGDRSSTWVQRHYGISRFRLSRARKRAMGDMVAASRSKK